MTACPKCKAELADGARFCPRCGNPVTQNGTGPQAKPVQRTALFRGRDVLLVAGLVALAAAGIWIAYVAGDSMRYAKHVVITVAGVEKKVKKVRTYYEGKKEEREVVEVSGTVDNRGDRTISQLTALVSLRNAKGEVVGSCEQPLSTSATEEPYSYRGGGIFPAHAVTRFIVDVSPVSDDWVPEKTEVTITELDLD